MIGVFADGRFIDEVAPWIERPDVADVLALDPARARSGAWARFQRPDSHQPEWLCTGFFIDLPVAVAPWLADAHIQVIQVSRELGLATEVEYGPGYPFGPRPRRDQPSAPASAPSSADNPERRRSRPAGLPRYTQGFAPE